MLEHDSVSPTAARICGVSILLAPVLLLASTLAFIGPGDGINDGVAGGTIGVWSCFAFILALTGMMRAIEPDAPRAAPLVSAMAVIGFAGGVAFNVHAIFLAHFGSRIDEFFSEVEGADMIGILAFLPWGWFAPLTLVATGILLWRTGRVPTPSAMLLVAGGVLFVASRPERIDWLAVVADTALLAALVPVGVALLTNGRMPAPREGRTA